MFWAVGAPPWRRQAAPTHRLVLNLLVLRLKLRAGLIRCQRPDIRETLFVVCDLYGKSFIIRRRLFVIRFQDLGLLLGAGKRGLQCVTLYWNGAGSI
jgi:hypothetical protein